MIFPTGRNFIWFLACVIDGWDGISSTTCYRYIHMERPCMNYPVSTLLLRKM